MFSEERFRPRRRLRSCFRGRSPRATADRIDFNRDIRPILADKCFTCHGPDPGRAQGQAPARQRPKARSAPAASGSLADRRRASSTRASSTGGSRPTDADERMPPPKSGKTLTAAEIDQAQDLDRAGGRVPSGTGRSCRPARRRSPRSSNAAWCRNPIDRFILARLEKEGLDAVARGRQGDPDPPAQPRPDRPAADARGGRRLPRRHAAATLTRSWSSGCSPRPTTASAGAGTGSTPPATPTPTATRRTSSRQVWFYRDWVINALNRDLPYDRFIIEQIAGDLLPGATQDQVVATGFLRNSMINEEGGIDPEQFRMEAMFDRMDAIGKGILGLTIQCAQCHNHKFDPLTQEEYYRLFAFLNNAHEANVAVYTPEEQMKRADDLPRRSATIEDDLQHRTPTGPSGWPRGRSRSRTTSRSGSSSGPRSTTISTGGAEVPAA